MMRHSAIAVVVFLAGLHVPGSEPVRAQVPTPESVLGFPVGADRRLADWDEITGYLGRVADTSDRVRMDTLGETTLDRPFVVLTISSPENLRDLDRYREIQEKLADPRRLESELEARELIEEGRVVVLITAAIHSTEVGTHQVPMRLAYRLATGQDPTARRILDQAIVLLVPSLNPDGTQMVVDWYESTLRQPWEGASPPFLYHHYVGHDNNRDWYAFTQKETRITVTRIHNVWHPQIVHDIHQMGGLGPRFFIPPWTDPIEPNVDPLLVAGINALGTAMAWQLYAEGKTGIAVNAIYDAWTPARAYQHYHAGVRILTETASARMATPVRIPFDSLETVRGFDPRESSWKHPEPWLGGDWRLADIVDYMESGAMALLEQAAAYREQWLRHFYRIGLRSIAGREGWPRAYVIPTRDQNPDGLPELVRILVTGDVEVRRAQAPFEVEGREFPTGTYVVPMEQPYAPFAQALLERQEYPDLRDYSGGPIRIPYDVTAHTLPLMMGVEVVASAESVTVALSAPIEAPSHRKSVAGLSGGEGRRIAIYESWDPSMDAGWTRWILDEYGIEYSRIHDDEVRSGDLGSLFDVIVLPDQPPTEILRGRPEGSLPPAYTGGLGEVGVRALREFVEAGGTLVAFNRASQFAIDGLELPVLNVVRDLERHEFYVPGSLLRMRLVADHPVAAGLGDELPIWAENALALEPTDRGSERVEIVGRYGTDDLLLSGWITGGHQIAGHGALAVVRQGAGRVVLFGFRPQYRGQTVATYPLMFNAFRAGVTAGRTDRTGGT